MCMLVRGVSLAYQGALLHLVLVLLMTATAAGSVSEMSLGPRRTMGPRAWCWRSRRWCAFRLVLEKT